MSLIINGFISMLVPLALTIIIELLVAWVLGIRTRSDYMHIIYANCLTNPSLNYIMILLNYFFKSAYSIFFLAILELAVIYVEYRYFKKNIKNSRIGYLLLSFLLNISSYIIGFAILSCFT